MTASSRATRIVPRIVAPRIAALALLALVATGCSGLNNQQQRALSGGAIGAAAGTVVGIVTGHALVGALVGGAGGAAVGALSK